MEVRQAKVKGIAYAVDLAQGHRLESSGVDSFGVDAQRKTKVDEAQRVNGHATMADPVLGMG